MAEMLKPQRWLTLSRHHSPRRAHVVDHAQAGRQTLTRDVQATRRGDDIYLTAYHRIQAARTAGIDGAGKLIGKAK